MHPSIRALSAAVAVTSTAATAHAHNHVTVDTATGAAGDRIRIRAGYYPDESSFSISGGRLLYGGAMAVYQLSLPIAAPSPMAGAIGGDDLFLTSDFYAATGRLAGGDFRWELASVAAIGGAGGTIAWGAYDATGTVFTPSAWSDGTTRAGRSFAVGFAGHDHDQAYAFTAPGTYDVTLVAWDANGRYADSLPLTVRFEVLPAPGAPALLGLAGLASARRRRG